MYFKVGSEDYDWYACAKISCLVTGDFFVNKSFLVNLEDGLKKQN